MADDLARRLLDAHVRFEAERLRGDGFADLVREEVDAALSAAARLTLDDVIDRDDVVAVAIKYVASVRLPGAIPELAGDIALRVRANEANELPIGEVFPRRHVSAAVRRIAEMEPARTRLAETLAENASVRLWLGDFLHSLATSAVESNRRLASRIPGVSAAFAVGDKLAGGAVREADKAARELADRGARGILTRWRDSISGPIDDDTLAAWLDVWDDLASREMGTALAEIDDADLVDLVTIGYDFWLELRESPYLHAMIGVGVDYFFDSYGATTLDELLDEFGLSRADLVEEALRFAPKVIAALDEQGELEAFVRRRLAPFYESAAAREVLGDRQ